MKVRTKTSTLVIKEEIFVAADGKEFKNRWECNEYEFAAGYREALTQIEHCAELENWRPIGDEEYPSGDYYYWFRPKTEAEAAKLNEVFGSSIKAEEHIGEWMCIEMTHDYEAWGTGLKECEEYVRHIFGNLGYEVEIKKREEGTEK